MQVSEDRPQVRTRSQPRSVNSWPACYPCPCYRLFTVSLFRRYLGSKVTRLAVNGLGFLPIHSRVCRYKKHCVCNAVCDVVRHPHIEMRWHRQIWLVIAAAAGAAAIGQDTCVTFESSASTFKIASNGGAAPILLSADEWPGVQRTATDFAFDIQRVTGIKPPVANVTAASSSVAAAARSQPPIIVGTLGKSSLIDQVVNNTKLDVSSIQGQWESFIAQEVANPFPGVKSAYIIIGSDKRGTIFAMYDHSEQFGALFVSSVTTLLTFVDPGVSPWWWYVSSLLNLSHDIEVYTGGQMSP